MLRGTKHSKVEVVAPEEEECVCDGNSQSQQSTRFLQQVNAISNDKKYMVLGFIHAETLKYRCIYSLTYLLDKAAVTEHQNMKTYTEMKRQRFSNSRTRHWAQLKVKLPLF